MPALVGNDTGSSPILSYNLKYFIGSNNSTLVDVVGGSQDNLLRVVSQAGLTTDTIYKFIYRVRNKYGWSEAFSPSITVRAANLPG